MADPDQIAKLLGGPLPGEAAQLQLAHRARRPEAPSGATPREAGVLVLLYPDAGGAIRFPLIVRSASDTRDKHAGQIALPGGRREREDTSIADTALREAAEEIGAVVEEVRVLGQLSPLYIPVSNFRVTATVGYAARAMAWRPQPSEVERIVHAPLAGLLADDYLRHTDMAPGAGAELLGVPYLPLAGEVVWGATAMMLSELRVALRGQRPTSPDHAP